MKRLHLLLLALLACGVLVAGCGGDDDNDTSDEPATTESAPADTTADEPEDVITIEEEGDDASGDGGAEAPSGSGEVGERAVEACKQSVQSAAQLSDDVKNDLEEICEKAAAGDEDAVREASVAVCKKIVEDSVPSGPAREQALSSCEQAGQ